MKLSPGFKTLRLSLGFDFQHWFKQSKKSLFQEAGAAFRVRGKRKGVRHFKQYAKEQTVGSDKG